MLFCSAGRSGLEGALASLSKRYISDEVSADSPTLLSICIIVLLVEGNEVNQAEAIVSSDKIDRMGWASTASPFRPRTAAPPVALVCW